MNDEGCFKQKGLFPLAFSRTNSQSSEWNFTKEDDVDLFVLFKVFFSWMLSCSIWNSWFHFLWEHFIVLIEVPSASCSSAPPPAVVQTPALHCQTFWTSNHFNCGDLYITDQQCADQSKLWFLTQWNHKLNDQDKTHDLTYWRSPGHRRPRCLAPPANPKRRLCLAGMDYRLVCSRGCGLKKCMQTSNRHASHTYAPVPGFSGVI